MGIFRQFTIGNRQLSVYVSDANDGNLAFHVRPGVPENAGGGEDHRDFGMAEFRCNVEKNRKDLFDKLMRFPHRSAEGLRREPVFMNQKHSTTVRRVRETTAGSPEADAIVTREKNTPLAVMTADCVPLILASARRETFLECAVVHAGRVGLLSGIIQETAEVLRARGPETVNVFVGPHICGRCYEVSLPLWEESRRRLPETASESRWGTPAVDLLGGVMAACADISRRHKVGLDIFLLSGEGVFPVPKGGAGSDLEKVHCTYEDEGLFSHRRYTQRKNDATRREYCDYSHNITDIGEGRFASVAWVN